MTIDLFLPGAAQPFAQIQSESVPAVGSFLHFSDGSEVEVTKVVYGIPPTQGAAIVAVSLLVQRI